MDAGSGFTPARFVFRKPSSGLAFRFHPGIGPGRYE